MGNVLRELLIARNHESTSLFHSAIIAEKPRQSSNAATNIAIASATVHHLKREGSEIVSRFPTKEKIIHI